MRRPDTRSKRLPYTVYVGSYQSRFAAGIHRLQFDAETVTFRYLQGLSGIENPSFLAWDEWNHHLYAVQETIADPKVFHIARSPEGRLQWRASFGQPTSTGLPCALTVVAQSEARWMLVANYAGGTVDGFRLSATGITGPRHFTVQHHGHGAHPTRQREAHPHSVVVDPSGRFVAVCDLGMDAIVIYRLREDRDSVLDRIGIVPCIAQSGPRWLAFHPSLPCWYVVNERNATISVYAWEDNFQAVHCIQEISSLPVHYAGPNAPAHLVFRQHRLYVSNRGHNSLAVFSVSQDDGRLEAITVVPLQARIPRHFVMTDDHGWMLVTGQESNHIEALRVDEGGLPQTTGVRYSIHRPTCIVLRNRGKINCTSRNQGRPTGSNTSGM